MKRVQITGDRYHPQVPPGAVKVNRPSRFGNPYKLRKHGGQYTLAESLALYDSDLRADQLVSATGRRPTTRAEVYRELAGVWALACRCSLDSPCHADILIAVIAEFADAEMGGQP